MYRKDAWVGEARLCLRAEATGGLLRSEAETRSPLTPLRRRCRRLHLCILLRLRFCFHRRCCHGCPLYIQFRDRLILFLQRGRRQSRNRAATAVSDAAAATVFSRYQERPDGSDDTKSACSPRSQ